MKGKTLGGIFWGIMVCLLGGCSGSAEIRLDEVPKETTYGRVVLKGEVMGESVKVRIKIKEGTREQVVAEFKPSYRVEGNKYKWESSVPVLKFGENEVVTEVVSHKGEVLSRKKVKIRRRSPAIFAAIIGVYQYEYKGFAGKCRYVRNDCEAFYRYITKYLGVNPKRVLRLYGKGATVRNIRHLLGVELPRRVQKDDFVFIYWAGLGATESLRSNHQARYFLGVRARPDRLYSRSISWREIKQVLIPKIGVRRVVMIADIAFDTTADVDPRWQRAVTISQSSKFVALAGARRGELEELLLKTSGYGIAFIMPQALSYEDASLRHKGAKKKGAGVFTYYVLQGMRGKADGAGGGRRDGIVGLMELLSYLHTLKGIPDNLRPVQELYVNGEMFVGGKRQHEAKP